MEIVEKGNKTIECPRCGCVMKFNYKDIKSDIVKTPSYFRCSSSWKIEYVRCPQCHKKIEVERTYLI